MADISFDYLVQLEQGRATNPSPPVLGALAKALRLSAADREVLYRLAGAVLPPSGSVPREIPAGVQRMIDRMSDTPAAVFTATWDAVQWNPLWGELLGTPTDRDSGAGDDSGTGDALARNMIWRHFAAEAPAGASCVEQDAAHTDALERMMVSDLRRAADRYPDDRAVTELIDGLRAAPRFDELWARYETLPLTGSHKTIVHPELGPITVDCDILAIEHADLHIVMNWAVPGTRDADKLDALREQAATAAR